MKEKLHFVFEGDAARAETEKGCYVIHNNFEVTFYVDGKKIELGECEDIYEALQVANKHYGIFPGAWGSINYHYQDDNRSGIMCCHCGFFPYNGPCEPTAVCPKCNEPLYMPN